jgi:small subunit ribosomal protein S2
MAQNIGYQDLLDAGVHFGHLTRKWDPRMAPYIFMERNGIHIIDLNKTLACLDEALDAVKDIVRQNKRIMFVATKKQAKELVAAEANRLKIPYVTERWLGGMLTNFTTVRKSLKKMQQIEKLLKDETTASSFNKKEKLMMSRDKEKLERVLGGIVDMKGLPAALFIIDIKKEHIAVAEAHKLGIPVIGMVDTNSNPLVCEFPIPANDDAFKSIALVTKAIANAIEEGMAERRQNKEDETSKEEEYKQQEEYLADGGEAVATAPAPAAIAAEVEAEVVTEAPAAEADEEVVA